jgi:hypothetical protein
LGSVTRLNVKNMGARLINYIPHISIYKPYAGIWHMYMKRILWIKKSESKYINILIIMYVREI